jgi:pectin methylesterase-like acyl-CoA thioesterase
MNGMEERSLILTGSLTLYVDGANGNDSNDGSQGRPFKTIQAAVNAVPPVLAGYEAVISIAGGTYTEKLRISGFTGRAFVLVLLGDVVINGDVEVSWCCTTFGITGNSNTLTINTDAISPALTLLFVMSALLLGAGLVLNCAGNTGLQLANCFTQAALPVTVNNAGNAVTVTQPGTSYIASVAGSGNTVAYWANAADLKIGSSTITAGTKIAKSNGGTIKTGAGVDLT